MLIVCAVAVNLTKNLLRAVIIFMSYSSVMCIVWILLESPDLAITEAAVGAGISGVLFLMTLKRVQAEDAGDDDEEEYENALADAARRSVPSPVDSGWPEAMDSVAAEEKQTGPSAEMPQTRKSSNDSKGSKRRKGRRS